MICPLCLKEMKSGSAFDCSDCLMCESCDVLTCSSEKDRWLWMNALEEEIWREKDEFVRIMKLRSFE